MLAIAKFKIRQCILMSDSPNLMLAKISHYTVFIFVSIHDIIAWWQIFSTASYPNAPVSLQSSKCVWLITPNGQSLWTCSKCLEHSRIVATDSNVAMNKNFIVFIYPHNNYYISSSNHFSETSNIRPVRVLNREIWHRYGNRFSKYFKTYQLFSLSS